MHNACRIRPGEWISRNARFAIYERDQSVCQLCFGIVDLDLAPTARMAATLDHIIPRACGGSDDPGNLQLAHRACNSAKGAKVA